MKTFFLKYLLSISLFFYSSSLFAGYFDVSGGFNFSRSSYANNSYSWTRKLGGSIGYHLTEFVTFEGSYQDSYDKNHYTDYEDSTYHDRVYSLNWVASFFGKEELFQPYTKLGIGLLNRDAMVVDSVGRTQESKTDSITWVIGLGFKIKLTQTLALRLEGTSYLSGGQIKTYKENFATTIGASFYF